MNTDTQPLIAAKQLKPPRAAYYTSRLFQPRCLLMTLAGRFYSVRKLYRSFHRAGSSSAAAYLSPYDKSQSLFPLVNLERSLFDLKEQGVAQRLDLPGHVVSDIRRFADSAVCYGDRKGKYGFKVSARHQAEKSFGKTFQQAQYLRSDLKECKAISQIENDAVLRSLASRYLGATPVHLTTRLFWSFANETENYDTHMNSTHYHYDLDDYGCIRFFFYLTDVDNHNGPHKYINGSHKRKSLTQKLSKSHALRNEVELADFYGEENVVTVKGPKGTGFAEDSMCFHKATRPKSGDRLLMQVTFAINDYSLHGDL